MLLLSKVQSRSEKNISYAHFPAENQLTAEHNPKAPHQKYGALLSDDIVFLRGYLKLLLWYTLDRIVYPLLAAVVGVNQTLPLAKHLVALFGAIAVKAI